jgi:hypothetical protein
MTDNEGRHRGWIKDVSRTEITRFWDPETAELKCRVISYGRRWRALQNNIGKTWREGKASCWIENKTEAIPTYLDIVKTKVKTN